MADLPAAISISYYSGTLIVVSETMIFTDAVKGFHF